MKVGWPLEVIYFCPDLFRRVEESMDLVEQLEKSGVETVQLSVEAFRKAAYREGPDGVLAQAIAREHSLEMMTPGPTTLLLVVEMVEKPGNLGALMRTANAAGADALLVCDPVCDLFNPNAIRASQGAFFQVPAVVTDTSRARSWLEEHQIMTVALAPDGESLLWEHDLRGPVALVVGAEDAGLSNEWLGGNRLAARLPMAGVTDSLNVSVAAGIALFEAVRQRR